MDSNTLQYVKKNCGDKILDLYVSTRARQRKYLSLDFEDLIYFTIYILNNFPEVKEKWQRRMNYAIVPRENSGMTTPMSVICPNHTGTG